MIDLGRLRKLALLSIFVASAPSSPTWAAPYACNRPLTEFDASRPEQAGYALTFADEFNDSSSIDLADSRQGRFKWFLGQFFHLPSSDPKDIEVSGGALHMQGHGKPVQIETAAPLNGQKGWIGKVFGGGGYFEARIALGPLVGEKPRGWPAFWGMAIEHTQYPQGDQWPGAPPGIEHFAEADFFEYDTVWSGPNTYGGAVVDWWGSYGPPAPDWRGVSKDNCPGYCRYINNRAPVDNYIVRSPKDIDLSGYHRYGALWVPLSKKDPGYIQFFFDGAPTNDCLTWTSPSSDLKSMFSILDQQRLFVILTTGPQSMSVDWVHIWQKP